MKSRHIAVQHRRTDERVLWVIDCEQWPRACLRAELIERGYDPYGFITINDALESLNRQASPVPELIILELRGQDLTSESVAAIRDLHVPIILLGGMSEFNEPVVRQHEWHIVLRRPVSLGKIADLAADVLANRRPSK